VISPVAWTIQGKADDENVIPLRDTIPSRTFPLVNYVLIGANVVLFFFELSLGHRLEDLFKVFGVIPAYYTVGQLAVQIPFEWKVIPLFSSMFLHGGWLHLIGNMWTLWIFGDNVEDRLGHIRYLFFYIGCGVLSALFHIFTNAGSPVPTIGASGAIAGVMGAYFILYPRARVVTLFVIIFFVEIIEIPAVMFLGFWFLIQFFNGSVTSFAGGASFGGVAWWAHVGGFLAGAYFVRWLAPAIGGRTWKRGRGFVILR
jgi:membrane associated rhomboid family serine protease